MIDYDEEWIIKLLFRRKGSVAARASLFAMPASLITVLLLFVDEYYPGLRRDSGMLEMSGSQVWATATTVLMLMLGFRAKQALDRFWEGTSLLHQMRGEWFDAVSCCITFTLAAKDSKPKEVMAFRHTIVRLMSLCHGSALEEIKDDETDIIETIDVAGLDLGTLMWIVECKETYNFNRVEMILHMMQVLITKTLEDGTLKIPPPILSRVYQTLSRGFVNLLNAKKITDTRFPFPFAQLITMLLFVQVLVTPLVMTVIFESKLFSAACTFCFVFGAFSINFISSELENPFGNDDNDLPLAHFQAEMNNSLLMLLHPQSDHLAGINEDCKTEISQLFVSRTTAWDENNINGKGMKNERLPDRQSLRSVMQGRRSSESSVVVSQSLRSVVGKASGAVTNLMSNTMEYDLRGSIGNIMATDTTMDPDDMLHEGAVEPIASSISFSPSSRGAEGGASGAGSPRSRTVAAVATAVGDLVAGAAAQPLYKPKTPKLPQYSSETTPPNGDVLEPVMEEPAGRRASSLETLEEAFPNTWPKSRR